eukprot:COSAG06_NODE_28265_length_577_cov_1.395397_1_plen_62_part_10
MQHFDTSLPRQAKDSGQSIIALKPKMFNLCTGMRATSGAFAVQLHHAEAHAALPYVVYLYLG